LILIVLDLSSINNNTNNKIFFDVGAMEVNASISNKNASFVFKGVFNTNKYHEFVISITNVADIKAFSWHFDIGEFRANKLQLSLMCLVLSNHLSECDQVRFTISKEHEQWIKWFEPVWSSRIRYEVIS
jgi:hypothetical protein